MDDYHQNQNPEYKPDAPAQQEPGTENTQTQREGQKTAEAADRPNPTAGSQSCSSPHQRPETVPGAEPSGQPGRQQQAPQQPNQPDSNQYPQNPYGTLPPQSGYGAPPPMAPWQQNPNPQQQDPYYNPYPQNPQPNGQWDSNQGNYDPRNYNQSPYQPPFHQQPNQPMQNPPRNNVAVTSMVLGIVSLLVSCCCLPVGFIGGFAIGMAGLVTAIVSKKDQPFSPFAIAGLVLSVLGICGSLFIFFCYTMTARLMQDPEYAALFNEILQQYYNGN